MYLEHQVLIFMHYFVERRKEGFKEASRLWRQWWSDQTVTTVWWTTVKEERYRSTRTAHSLASTQEPGEMSGSWTLVEVWSSTLQWTPSTPWHKTQNSNCLPDFNSTICHVTCLTVLAPLWFVCREERPEVLLPSVSLQAKQLSCIKRRKWWNSWDSTRDEVLNHLMKSKLYLLCIAFPVNKNAECWCACVRMITCTCSIILSMEREAAHQRRQKWISLSCW